MSTELKDRISSDIKIAMKSGDTLTRDTLRVLMSEVHRGQLTNDEDITSEVKKMIQNLKEANTDTSQQEIFILENYMPKQLTEGEMIHEVAALIIENDYNSMKDMGAIMGYFSTNFRNQYDGQKLSIIVRNQLK